MIYLDTSVLLAFTLMKKVEPDRYAATAELFDLIEAGAIKAATSFYALHELLVIARRNTLPDWEMGSELAREALLAILQTRLLLLPIAGREDKITNARLFSALRDPSDMPNAIAAYAAGCDVLVAYDEHFRAIGDVIAHKTPEEVVAEARVSGG